MGATKTQVMNLLELRYDYQSARNVLVNWRKAAGIKDDSENLDDAQLRCLLAYLKNNESAAERVYAAIERLILTDNGEMPAENIAEAPAAEVVAEAPVAEAVAEAVADAPAFEENAWEAQVSEENADDAQVSEENADDAQAADENADDAQAADENADNRAAEGGKKKKNKKR